MAEEKEKTGPEKIKEFAEKYIDKDPKHMAQEKEGKDWEKAHPKGPF